MSLALAAHAEVGQALGLPPWGLAGATDAKCLDAQAGAEAAYHILAQGLAGLNLIHDWHTWICPWRALWSSWSWETM